MNWDKVYSNSTDKLLMVMIGLLVRHKVKDQAPLRDQIHALSELGLKPIEIATAIGRSSTYVNKELSLIRKANKGG